MERQSGYYWVQKWGTTEKSIALYSKETDCWERIGEPDSIMSQHMSDDYLFVGKTPIEFEQTFEDTPLRKELVMKFIESGRPFNSEVMNQMAEYIKTGK